MGTQRAVVIGAGIGGLVAALRLAAAGLSVEVVERQSAPGGKMRAPLVAGRPVDSGPTVLTLRRVLDEILDDAGLRLDDLVELRPAAVLARHAWSEAERLDLFADERRSEDAIGSFAGAVEARGYRRFMARAREVFTTLDASYMRHPQPSIASLMGGVGLFGLGRLRNIKPFTSLWDELGRYFKDPRLRQLFGRYATYCGSSPFQSPATLMLVAHVEQAGVWYVEGGMHSLALALARAAADLGVTFRYDSEVVEIQVAGARARAVRLADGTVLEADAVVSNVDVAAIATGRFGAPARGAVPRSDPAQRSLSAVTWSLVAETAGLPLVHHNVLFSRNYQDEFSRIFARDSLPDEPTVYICAQDRADDDAAIGGPERLLCLVNAPAVGDRGSLEPKEIDRCEERTFAQLERCGLTIRRRSEATIRTSPNEFEVLFPATGGALYGRSSHGWKASFERPTARAKLPGLYLSGGSVHPGPGIPMAALSGRMAADAVLKDLGSTIRSRPAAMPGGMSTGSVTTRAAGSR